MYGTALRLPGEMIPDISPLPGSDAAFLRSLQDSLREQARPAPRPHSHPSSYVPDTLRSAEAVYIWHDARRLPLQQPYDGPFRVLERGAKTFRVGRNGQAITISVDRLKPAFGSFPSSTDRPRPRPAVHRPALVPRPPPAPDNEAPLPAATTTRYGRVSHPPVGF